MFTITTSWDDGHPLDLRLAELLARHGLAGTFYVPLSNSRPTLSTGEIRELSKQFEIGAHTVHHLRLTDLSATEANARDPRIQIETGGHPGEPCRTFCFPGGRFRPEHIQMLKNAGYVAARTVELLSLRSPSPVGGLAVIPTSVQAYPHSFFGYVRNAAKRRNLRVVCKFLSLAVTRDWVLLAKQMLASANDTGGVFHLWGHSWEIDELGQWQALKKVLVAMSEYGPTASFVTNSELCADQSELCE